MNEDFMSELDALYASGKMNKIDSYLKQKYAEAVENKDDEYQIIILNKQIEYYVSVRKNEMVTKLCEEVQEKITEADLRNTEVEADTILNMAKVYTELGRYDDAMQLFAQAMPLYTSVYGKMDTHMAELYIGLSELFKKNNDYEKASQALLSAVEILAVKWDGKIACAIARIKLASCYLQMDELNKADYQIDNAIAIYEEDEDRDVHYSDALAVLGQLRFKQRRFTEAALYTHQAMDELKAKLGKTEMYYQLDKVLQQMQQFCKTPLKVKPEPEPEPVIIEETEDELLEEELELEEEQEVTDAEQEDSAEESSSEAEAEVEQEELETDVQEEIIEVQESPEEDDEVESVEENTVEDIEDVEPEDNKQKEESTAELVEPKMEQDVPIDDSKQVIEVYTDALESVQQSRAFYENMAAPLFQAVPEWNVKFAIGLAGEALLRESSKQGLCIWLTEEESEQYGDVIAQIYEALQKQNNIETTPDTGVLRIKDFYQNLLGSVEVPFTDAKWSELPEDKLYLATNGEVFVDNAGEFSRIREYLKEYYPDNIRRKKIAELLERMGQYGQLRFEQSVRRADYFSADMMISAFARETLRIMFALNKQYAPTDDLLYVEAGTLHELSDMVPLLKAMYEALKQSDRQRIVNTRDRIIKNIVLELRRQELTESDSLDLLTQSESVLDGIVEPHKAKENIIARIQKLENHFYEKISSDDNYEARQILQGLRTEQFRMWSMDMLKCLEKDMLEADKMDRNLVSEKYIRMMKSTAPLQYKYIENLLPLVSETQLSKIEQIICIFKKWIDMLPEQFAGAIEEIKKVYAIEQSQNSVSFEVICRGELETYSERLVDLTLRYLNMKEVNGENLVLEMFQQMGRKESVEKEL